MNNSKKLMLIVQSIAFAIENIFIAEGFLINSPFLTFFSTLWSVIIFGCLIWVAKT